MSQQLEAVHKTIKAAALRRLREIQQGESFKPDELKKLADQIIDADSKLMAIENGTSPGSTRWPDLGKPATQADLARLVKVARSTIHGHHDSGVFAEGAELGDWLQSYIDKLRTEAAGRTAESDEEMRQAKLRDMNVKAQKGELEIAQMEKQLVDRQVVFDELYPALLHMKTTLEAAGGRIATALSAQYGITINQRLLDNEFRTALHVIADYTPAQRESGQGTAPEREARPGHEHLPMVE